MAFSGSIAEIWAQYDSQHLTIWKPGMAVQQVKIPPGKSWELHILTLATYPEVGSTGWATAATIGGGDFSAGNSRLHAAFITGGGYEFAFNMGAMPNSVANVNRVRFWWNQAFTNVPPLAEAR